MENQRFEINLAGAFLPLSDHCAGDPGHITADEDGNDTCSGQQRQCFCVELPVFHNPVNIETHQGIEDNVRHEEKREVTAV